MWGSDAGGRGNGWKPAGGGDGRRVAVVGCGHVGAVVTAALAALGHRVVGVDLDPDRVRTLAAGRTPFLEPGLEELLAANLAAGRLAFTTSHREALAGAEFVFLCVDTPLTAAGGADVRQAQAAVRQVARALVPSAEPPLLVLKSTLPIGTAEAVADLLERTFPRGRPRVAVNPEFLREGRAVHDVFHPDRVVVGAEVEEDAARLAALYAPLAAPVLHTDLRTAELIKYVANAFLAARVSFINEVARLCERLGVEVDAVAAGVGMDARIGREFFTPGIGYGGSCLPKDVAALRQTGGSVGVDMRMLAAVQEANADQRRHAVDTISGVLGSLAGRTVAAWGLTFKGGTEDLRESPALEVIGLLRAGGATVRAYDPALPPGGGVDLADVLCSDAVEAARGAHCVTILADWPEFAAADWPAVRAVMAGRLVYDGRNVASRDAVEAAGLLYHGVGRPPVPFAAARDGGRQASQILRRA